MSIEKRQEEIIAEFELFDEWMEKYEYIIELGKSLPLNDNAYKDEEHKIRGCQSQVTLHAELQDGKVQYSADSDAIITKGLVSLMIRVLNGLPPEEIASEELSFLDKIGLHEHLSPTRSNGLRSMVKQMKLYALAFAAQQKSSEHAN